MKILLIYILLFFLSLSFTSCKPIYEKIVNDSYIQNDSLIICDFLVFNRIQVGVFKSIYSSKEGFSDSIIGVFNQSFKKLDIDFRNYNSKNSVDSSYLANKYNGSWRYPPNELILDVAGNCEKNLVLVPLIDVFHGGLGSEGGPTYYDIVNFTAFMVKNNEVIYAFNYEVQSKSFFAAEHNFPERPFNLLTEEDWDELIKGAMQPYLDRLK